MKNTIIIYRKQLKDTGKNMALWIQFVMFPVMAAIMENSIRVEGMPEHFFVGMFTVMHVGMAPLTVSAAIISEEKEKNTLRMLRFANVKPLEYLCGTGGFVFTACMAGGVAFGFLGGYMGEKLLLFCLIMAAGILASMLFGAAIGVWSRTQIAATAVVTPMMMVFAFLPMLAMFNQTIEKIADIAYSQHIQLLLNSLNAGTPAEAKNVIVIAANVMIAAVLFGIAYRRRGLM
ncbi:MAG: ABC transporter permease [Lachnospiraceae bacterium]|nr:ABC transporter permease [Lachnospiraceae bacterium]